MNSIIIQISFACTFLKLNASIIDLPMEFMAKITRTDQNLSKVLTRRLEQRTSSACGLTEVLMTVTKIFIKTFIDQF